MKVYVAVRYKGTDNKQQIEELCAAVHDAKMIDFCFVRDVEHYQKTFDDPKELWARAYDEIGTCDALLIDVTDYPTGGRLVEAGIAYALRMPIIIVKRKGTHHKGLFDGIASTIIEYTDYKNLTEQLKKFDDDRNFNLTDRWTMLLLFLLPGAAIGWFLSQLFIPLGIVGATIYWLVARHFVAMLRVFDRIVIYIPLTIIWATGIYYIQPFSQTGVIAWMIGFWLVALLILRKFRFSL